MKTRNKILLLLLTVFMFTSCVDNHFYSDDKIELTTTNYFDIAMVQEVYYKSEISKVDAVLDSLQKIIDAGQADQKTKDNCYFGAQCRRKNSST